MTSKVLSSNVSFFIADLNETSGTVKLKTFGKGSWKLTLNKGINIKEILVHCKDTIDSSEQTSASGHEVTSRITISTRSDNGSPEGIRIEQLPEGEGNETELHHSLEESGNHSKSQLVCSGQFTMEKKETTSSETTHKE